MRRHLETKLMRMPFLICSFEVFVAEILQCPIQDRWIDWKSGAGLFNGDELNRSHPVPIALCLTSDATQRKY